MLMLWIALTFGLISQTKAITENSSHVAIIDTSQKIDIDSSEISDLENAETKDSDKQIVKQIRRVNTDGSFLVGYETVDGQFKIESRDVLGNVKGTYGYVDENGEIKRVSYTANNTTNGLRSSPQPINNVVNTSRQNKSESSMPENYSSSSVRHHKVIQPIPKRRILLTSPSQFPSKYRHLPTTSTTKKADQEPTTTIIYASSLRSSIKPSSTASTINEPLQSKKIEISDRFSKVLNMNKNIKVSHDLGEENKTKSERKISSGNVLRRQLSNDQSENFETNTQVVYSQSSDEDSVHTYSGVTGTQRPIFTTTSSPRIPALVLAARNRAEKLYSKPPRQKSYREESNGPYSENEYLTQSPVAVQIPANRNTEQNTYLPKHREYIRQIQPLNGLEISQKPHKLSQMQNDMENAQYLRDTSNAKDSINLNPPQHANNDVNAATQPVLQSFRPRFQGLYESQQNLRNDYDQRLQVQNGAPRHQYHNNFDRPLTARDFERLLNFLVLRHQQYQRLLYLSNQNILGYGYGYNNPLNQPPLYNHFDPRYTSFSRSLPPVPPPPSFYAPYSEQENIYQASKAQGYYGSNNYERTDSNDLPYQKNNAPETIEYLPSDIREELLYRMLMLAVQPGINYPNNPDANSIQEYFKATAPSTTTTMFSTEPNSKKPVRSVQILGEE